MEKLNTLTSFKKGIFQIVRDGEIITLTPNEIREIYKLIDTFYGYDAISTYLDWANDEESLEIDEINALELMANDEEECFKIRERYTDIICNGEIEMEVVSNALDEYLLKFSKE